MTSRATPRFWTAFNQLPPQIQEAARKAYRLFIDNPRHPSLQFKRVHDREPIYSVRVTSTYRAIGRLEGNVVLWFWIGNHDEYERLIKTK